MAEFWEQQLMDRILSLAFEFKQNDKEVLPKEKMNDIIDYVKYLLKEQAEKDSE